MQQPWAWAIMHGGKTVENRTQPWSYRGPLVIHAGAHWSGRGARSGVVWSALEEHRGIPTGPDSAREQWPHMFPMGAALGVVDLVDVHPGSGRCCEPWGDSCYAHPDADVRDPVRINVVHLVLENPRAFVTPIPARGRLGLWHDVDLFAEVRRCLTLVS